MTVPFRLRPSVYDDIRAVAAWYDRERNNLGDEFVEAVYAAFEVIADRPTAFPIVWRDARRALLKRFPYAIYFRLDDVEILILTVIHTARSPRAWKLRSR